MEQDNVTPSMPLKVGFVEYEEVSIKSQEVEFKVDDSIEQLKQHVSDTLTFLYQERNDFLPDEDIIIPSRKDDHVSLNIDLDNIRKQADIKRIMFENKKLLKENEEIANNVRVIVQNEITYVMEELTEDNDDLNKQEDWKYGALQYIQHENDVLNVDGFQSLGDDLRNSVRFEVEDVIRKAEILADNIKKSTENLSQGNKLDMVDIKESLDDSVQETLDDLSGSTLDNSFQKALDDSLVKAQQKSEEAFRFLEHEASSPIIKHTRPCFEDSLRFIQNEIEENQFNVSYSPNKLSPTKSSIPIAKPRQKDVKIEKEKDLEMLFSSLDPTDNDILSKIPISAKGKIKTIKKHSKDPLKEFVKLTQDVNWDENDRETVTVTSVTIDPIVRTTVTKITTEQVLPEVTNQKSKIPLFQGETHYCEAEKNDLSPKSKIPVLVTETTRIVSPESIHIEKTVLSTNQIVDTTIVSPGSDKNQASTKSSTVDSDSDDTDSRTSPPLKGILKKNSIRTVGSSSGSDIALHEAGAELSDDDSGMSNGR